MSSKSSNVDVLVIGAGPSGSMLAFSLMKAGVRCRIIDKRDAPVDRGHADALQPRVQEILNSHGLLENALKYGNKINTTSIWHPGKDGNIERVTRVPNITAPRGLYPWNLTNHQGAHEAVFTSEMPKYGGSVERPFVPTFLAIDTEQVDNPDAYPVTVEIQSTQDPTVKETIRAKYVVGADGAHSYVRKSASIETLGDHSDRYWGVIDFVPDTDFPDIRATSQVHSDTGFCLIVPREDDMVRLYIPLDETAQYRSAGAKKINVSAVNPDDLLKIAKRAFKPYYMNAPEGYHWYTVYVVGQRVAEKFSVHNRLFLAGDACHTHSPKAGQGMNAGINDAHNLAWKLIYAIRKWGHMRILDTYETERRGFALDLIRFDKQYVAMFEQMALNRGEIDPVIHAKAVQSFGLFKSGIGIHYAESMISCSRGQSAARNLIVGKRFPPEIILTARDDRVVQIHDVLPSDTKFKLLIFTGDLCDDGKAKVLKELAVRLVEEKLITDWSYVRKDTQIETMRVVDVLTIVKGSKGSVVYTDVPESLRTHWKKVFIDDVDITGEHGGRAYQNFGIGYEGAMVIVRPDGYVGMVTSLGDVQGILGYFRPWGVPLAIEAVRT
ncbi:FAD binding domain-containing protein [Rhodocollybia butyracea]|uniref:FAD binding domain-containing protein n=1 Tax=Rhodocollybia butyracea TaxID=206335 RepID=A0A9P5U1E6_9AGAR|nr:FAD binding domain-containing protein [Rhodocollybia butyracea]